MMLDLVLRWIHILSAIVLVGGTFFLRFSLFPALATLPKESRDAFQETWRRTWARAVMITSGLLLISGLFNAVRMIVRYEFPDSPYHMLVAVKLLLALALFWLSAVIAGRSAMAERFRANALFWLNITLTIAVLLVGIGGYMKMMPRVEKETVESKSVERDTVKTHTVQEMTVEKHAPVATTEVSGRWRNRRLQEANDG